MPSTGASAGAADSSDAAPRALSLLSEAVDARPNIVSIDDDVDGEDARVTVTLGWAEKDWHGQAVGSASQRPRLAGEATLDAVTRFAVNAPPLELLALATTDLGSARVALAQVRYGPQEILVGSAIQGEVDDRLAAARAVMDAINRRLSAVL